MLSEVSPEQFDEWVAFDRIEMDPIDRLRVIAKFGLAAISRGLPANPSDLDPVKPVETTTPNTHTPEQAIAAIGLAYGSK
jgi:hypothetical protein